MRGAFLYMSLPSLHDCDVKKPTFTFSGGRKQAHDECFFLFLNLSVVLSRGNTRTNSQSNSYVILRPKCFLMSHLSGYHLEKEENPRRALCMGNYYFRKLSALKEMFE